MEHNLTIIPPEISLALPEDEYILRAWSIARLSFLDHVQNRKGQDKPRVRTRRVYEVALRQFLDGLISNNSISNVPIWPPVLPWQATATLANQWFDRLSRVGKPVYENGVEVGRTGLSAQSVNVKLAALKSFYDYVRHKFEIPYTAKHDPFLKSGLLFFAEDRRSVLLWSPEWRNPFDPKVVARLPVNEMPVYPTTQEVAAILSKIDASTLIGKRDYALLLTLFSTACRSEEILNLRWGDLHPTPGGNYAFFFWGKGGKYEGVELQREVYQVICDYLTAAGRLATMDKGDYIFAPLFPNRIERLMPNLSLTTNRPLSNDTANQILKRYAQQAGVDLDRAHLHGLRHARARHTIDEMTRQHGVADVMVVNRILRHSSLAVTQRYIETTGGLPEDTWATAAIAAVKPNGANHASQ